MKKLAGVGIILVVGSLFAVGIALIVGVPVWQVFLVLAVALGSMAAWVGIFRAAVWLDERGNHKLSWAVMGLNLTVFPSLWFEVAGAEWWCWPLVVGMAAGIMLVSVLISYGWSLIVGSDES